MTTTLRSSALLLAVVTGTLVNSGCVWKQVHCKFVADVGAASANYQACATKVNNPGWQAEADQLKQTVDSEKQNYCK